MPLLDGFQTTLLIRAHEREQGLPAVPLLFVTGDIQVKSSFAKYGAHGCIVKPVVSATMETIIREHAPAYFAKEVRGRVRVRHRV